MKASAKKMSVILFLFATVLSSRAQETDASLLNQVSRDDQAAVDAVAMYPKDVRSEIFTAAMYPEIIVRLNTMQKKTNAKFNALLASYSKEEQEKIYNLTRYPDLITQLANGHPKSEAEIKTILTKYPDEIQQTALDEGVHNYDLLVHIDQNGVEYSKNFETMISSYPPQAVNAFRELIKIPEVLSTLTDNMQFTVVIGDVYKRNPDLVMQKTDSLNVALSQKNKQEASEWQQTLKENPQAQQQYEQAAQEYAQENGYKTEEYATPRSPEIENYTSYSYNWWFGYPVWAPHAYWDPYPYWYDWGFYYGPHRRVVFIGMPSTYFLNWYFYNPQHHVRFPELSAHYYTYYYGHRGAIGYNSISRSVYNWHNRNADIVTSEWDRDPARRVQLFKEYGQMEVERRKYNQAHPEHILKRPEFIENHKDSYKNIRPLNNEPRRGNYSRPMPEPEPPVNRPRVGIPGSYNLKDNATPEPHQEEHHFQQQHDYKQMNNAVDNHKSSWQQLQQPRFTPQPHQENTAPGKQNTPSRPARARAQRKR